MIKNSADKLYIGVTMDPDKRVNYHNQKRGASFTKYITDFKIVFLENYKDLAVARQREIQLKKWSRVKKEFLIEKYEQGLETRK
jgi:putative endonuclease